jgi:hypothetical protein
MGFSKSSQAKFSFETSGDIQQKTQSYIPEDEGSEAPLYQPQILRTRDFFSAPPTFRQFRPFRVPGVSAGHAVQGASKH